MRIGCCGSCFRGRGSGLGFLVLFGRRSVSSSTHTVIDVGIRGEKQTGGGMGFA